MLCLNKPKKKEYRWKVLLIMGVLYGLTDLLEPVLGS